MSICYVDSVIRFDGVCILYDVRVFYSDRIRKYTGKKRDELPKPVSRFMNLVNRESCEELPGGNLHCTYRRGEK